MVVADDLNLRKVSFGRELHRRTSLLMHRYLVGSAILLVRAQATPRASRDKLR
jgi:hypothetical protein